MKKLVFNDSRQIEVQSVNDSNGVLHVRLILTTAEALKALFGDEFATKKMTYFENQKQMAVYENYTIFKYVKEETGGIFEVEMRQTEADDQTRIANMEKEMQVITKGDAELFNKFMEAQSQTLSDEDALNFAVYSPTWALATHYNVGIRVNYNEVLYKCLQAHTSQAMWTPDAAPSLWAKVLVAEDGSISEWQQPDSTNPYMKGDKVTYNGKTWVSDVDNNVWEPGVYGWTEKTE